MCNPVTPPLPYWVHCEKKKEVFECLLKIEQEVEKKQKESFAAEVPRVVARRRGKQSWVACHAPASPPRLAFSWSSCIKLKWPSHKLGHLYLPVMSRNKTPSSPCPCSPCSPPRHATSRTNGTQTALAIATNIKCEM